MTDLNRHNTTPSPKRPLYIEGVGWRYATEHRMTRWPRWKDSHKPGTYMITIKVNENQQLLGTLEGSTSVVYQWMKEHKEQVQAASTDPLYYRHALLGNKVMPFVQKAPKGVSPSPMCTSTYPPTESSTYPSRESPTCVSVSTQTSSPPSSSSTTKPRTHFPIEALHLPQAPHIILSPLGEKVRACWEHMTKVVPQVEHICLTIMPNHIHAIIAVRSEMPRSIGAVIRSFMGTTTHTLHKMIKEGTIQWQSSSSSVSTPPEAKQSSFSGVSMPLEAPNQKPSLWQPGYCTGICNTEEKLHTRIGYVLENPFFAILEKEQHHFMERFMLLNIAGRTYKGYGNILLLKEPDRIQVFCHRRHPVTGEPYHLTQDFKDEKNDILYAASNGAVIVTPGISPSEADIMWSVLQTGGNVINIRQVTPFDDRWHPEKERRIYCSNGQMLILSIHEMPQETFYDKHGRVIPADTKYARFHILNIIAKELCTDGIEHECRVNLIKATT